MPLSSSHAFDEFTLQAHLTPDGEDCLQFDDGSLTGVAFDNTGLHRVWPASLALCKWLVTNRSKVAGHRILEVGAGTGLPSLLCKQLNAELVVATDTNEQAVEKLRHLVDHVACLDFDVADALEETVRTFRIDTVILADVVYPSKDFTQLLMALRHLLLMESDAPVLRSADQPPPSLTILMALSRRDASVSDAFERGLHTLPGSVELLDMQGPSETDPLYGDVGVRIHRLTNAPSLSSSPLLPAPAMPASKAAGLPGGSGNAGEEGEGEHGTDDETCWALDDDMLELLVGSPPAQPRAMPPGASHAPTGGYKASEAGAAHDALTSSSADGSVDGSVAIIECEGGRCPLSPSEFRRRFRHRQPVLLRGLARYWPALSRWTHTPTLSASLSPGVAVRCLRSGEGRQRFLSADCTQTTASLAEVVGELSKPGYGGGGTTHQVQRSGPQSDGRRPNLYARAPLAEGLHEAVDLAQLTKLMGEDEPKPQCCSVWLGAAGHVTPFHCSHPDASNRYPTHIAEPPYPTGFLSMRRMDTTAEPFPDFAHVRPPPLLPSLSRCVAHLPAR